MILFKVDDLTIYINSLEKQVTSTTDPVVPLIIHIVWRRIATINTGLHLSIHMYLFNLVFSVTLFGEK